MSRNEGVRRIRSPIIRWALIAFGIVCVGLGTVGIFVPMLPTTPFLLLAAACFVYSSKRMHDWLLDNRLFGRYLKDYIDRKGIPMGIKIGTLLLLWGSIMVSIFFFADTILVRALLLVIASGVTVHLLWIKTKR
ncbi:MAG: YbaN family protein [Candidatus Thermoplasmatota archaeon]|nr:YbaN family protein [Candidatus Thermoplasmatota archaeon]